MASPHPTTNPSSQTEAPPGEPIPMLDLTAQYQALREEILAAVTQVIDSQVLIGGERVEAFERQMADYCEAAHAVGVASGSDALLASLMALDVGRGDEVILPAFTFFASAGAIARLGAIPVFVDIDPTTFNLDPAAARAAITSRTRAIMPVHLFGQMAPMAPLKDLAARYNLAIVEDAAQAIGAQQGFDPAATTRATETLERAGPLGSTHQAGTVGHCGCFSFFPSKNLGGAGDGGMVVTNDPALADKLRALRNHGMTAPYHHQWVGGNFRLDAVQAAYLSVKLAHLDTWSQQRRANAGRYNTSLADLDAVTTPRVAAGNTSIFNQYVIRSAERDALKAHLASHQIGSAVYYPKGVHEQPCFADLGYQRGDLPITEQACDEVLALPIYPELTEAQIDRVSETIRGFYGAGA